MTRRIVLPIVALAALTASIAVAQTRDTTKTAPPRPPTRTTQQPPPTGEMPLPPGWTEADMQACMQAGIPGPQHARLAESAGVWNGKSTMWMYDGAEPMPSECTYTVTVWEDRFLKGEMHGDMPGMGPFNGFGIYGFDNVAQKFQSSWISNCGTGIMQGTGDLSSDGKSLTWKFSHMCPVTKKPTTIREIERVTGKDSKTLEIFGVDPKTNKEFKMMEIAFTRVPGTGTSAGASGSRSGH